MLERCDLFIGNDSGTAHLAAAMDCKTIVISRHPRDGDPNHSNSPVRFGSLLPGRARFAARDWIGLRAPGVAGRGAALHHGSLG